MELAGLAHFLPLVDTNPVYLYSFTRDRLPAWSSGYQWPVACSLSTNFLPHGLGLREHREGEFVVIVSAPERAMLGFLQHPTLDDASYEHARLVFEGLGTAQARADGAVRRPALRPDLVQSLLKACTSVKVKRLFPHLAEKHAHTWFKHLDLAKVSLGSGKRVLFVGGRLNSKYPITVPAAA